MATFRDSRLSRHQRSVSRCSVCNNLDPRGHLFSGQDERSGTFGNKRIAQWSTSLSLPIDTRRLARLTARNCRFCRLLADAIQAYYPSWLQSRPSVVIYIGWNTPVKLSITGQEDSSRLVEIFNDTGKLLRRLSAFIECLAPINRNYLDATSNPRDYKSDIPRPKSTVAGAWICPGYPTG